MSAVTSTNALAKDSTLQDVADAISTMGATSVGNLSALTTTDKTSLVGAVNELRIGLTSANSNISRIDSVPLYVTKTSDIQLASEASGTVSFAKSDFVIPNGYTANWGAYIYSVVGAWGIACDSDACFNSGEPYFTDSNALVVNVKSHVSGGNVIFRVAVSVMITPTT